MFVLLHFNVCRPTRYNPFHFPSSESQPLRPLQELAAKRLVLNIAAILKIQVHELEANAVKTLYAKNPDEIRKIKFCSTTNLNIAASWPPF